MRTRGRPGRKARREAGNEDKKLGSRRQKRSKKG